MTNFTLLESVTELHKDLNIFCIFFWYKKIKIYRRILLFITTITIMAYSGESRMKAEDGLKRLKH